MNNEVQCNIVSDLLPLYVDDLTSEGTNSFIKKHLEECPDCQKDYLALEAELSQSVNKKDDTKIQEVDYLKKINVYQKTNFILGAIISFLLGASMPVLRVGVPVLLNGAISEYYLARLQVAWHIGLLKMVISGAIVCIIYMLMMFGIGKKIKRSR